MRQHDEAVFSVLYPAQAEIPAWYTTARIGRPHLPCVAALNASSFHCSLDREGDPWSRKTSSISNCLSSLTNALHKSSIVFVFLPVDQNKVFIQPLIKITHNFC
jgi:hypothetical protein